MHTAIETKKRRSRHALYHTLVVVGGSLAAGAQITACGGKATTTSPNQGETPCPDDAVDCEEPGTGGSVIVDPEMVGIPEMLPHPQYVHPGQGGAGGSLPFEIVLDCPSQQLDCSGAGLICAGAGDGLRLDPESFEDCECRPGAPSSDEDCAPDQLLSCRLITSNAHREPYDEPIAVDCHCVSPPEASCNEVCQDGGPTGDVDICLDWTGDTVLCGCGYVVLR